MRSNLLLALVVAGGIVACARAQPEDGRGELEMRVGDDHMRVFTYRPLSCDQPSVLLVFHGLNRKAQGVRDKAIDLADRACLMVLAPLFDKKTYPNWRYHRAGVVRDGKVQPRSRWTDRIIRDLIAQALDAVGNTDARVYLFGHSAGAQLLSRLSAYADFSALARIVVANPSVHVVPDVAQSAPYGFGGVFDQNQARDQIRRYLGSPITVYVGQEDTREKHLVQTDAANLQGRNRVERGRNIFFLARDIAQDNGWDFAWKLVEAPGVGHSSGGMLRSYAAGCALGLTVAPFSSEPPPVTCAEFEVMTAAAGR